MKTKHYLVIIMIAVLGFWGNKLIGLALKKPAHSQLARLDISGFDVKPYQRGDIENDRDAQAFLARAKAYRLAGAGTHKPSARGGLMNIAAAKKAPLAKKDPKKEALEKKKKAAALAKRKKALAARRARAGVARDYAQGASVYSEASDRRPSQNEITPNTFSSGTASQAAADTAQNEKNEKDLAYWKQLLLSAPNAANTTQFIRAFQKNEISEEIFFAIVQLMYEQKTQEFQLLAIEAAGSVSNIRSFDFLVAALADQSQGSPVAAAAEREIGEYASLNSIFVIKQVLSGRTQDEGKILFATLALDSSTEDYLTAGAGATSSLTPIQQQVFISFIPVLENVLSLYPQNPQVAQAGQRALERIKGIEPVVAQTRIAR